jgi:hypothetical protein
MPSSFKEVITGSPFSISSDDEQRPSDICADGKKQQASSRAK